MIYCLSSNCIFSHKNAIDQDIPVHTHLLTNYGGHAVVVIGWWIKRYGNKDFRFLKVMSGWTNEVKYVPFETDGLRFFSLSVNIK